MESIDLITGGILCVWDINSFRISNHTVSDSFVMTRGDYLTHVTQQWNGDVIIMGDFNEVRLKSDRFGSVFNVHRANLFNTFITNAGLKEVPLGGSSFTWCHNSASKMSKLDRFLISNNLFNSCPYISAITLERYLLDHRPILLREAHLDYGPTPHLTLPPLMKLMVLIKLSKPLGKTLLSMLRMLLAFLTFRTKASQIETKGRTKAKKNERNSSFRKINPLEKASEVGTRVTRKEELKQAVWDCGTDKSPGPDGFTFGFFRKFWHLIEEDIFEAVHYFFCHDGLLRDIFPRLFALEGNKLATVNSKIEDEGLINSFRRHPRSGGLSGFRRKEKDLMLSPRLNNSSPRSTLRFDHPAQVMVVTPKANHSVSSSSAHHYGSSSHHGDEDEDDDASRASTPSSTTYLNSLSPFNYQKYDIPTSSQQDDDLLFERQTALLNQMQKLHEEVRGGFKSFRKALKGVFSKKKK
ncbi:RNA-directed DNA polymerase, eukaryota, reverse transcriptase zinc-binding domain protein [Tanacetum coccineum]|uniref:RNA-directed DNA polymerase, eukaryota, reverse transcriptase zinc-binding domain protein n=1 Tax=Tanacetum coccineum TaxID=301880 RepID=A0ABQ5HPB4_9ASTR